MARLFSSAQDFIAAKLSWFYILAVAIILCAMTLIAVSRFGSIRLGPDHARPAFSLPVWFAMLFSTGMGIGIMFFGIAEPVMHFLAPPGGEAQTVAAARSALETTFFHWGLHAWAIYAAVGLMLAYFGFRRGLPLTLRSALYPLIGERIFTDKVDHVATENVEGAKRATKYLLQTGCRRLAVVGTHPGEKVGSAALRLQGYLEALEEMGIPFDERLVVPSKMWHRDDGLRAMNTLLDSGVVPDGVVALNDMLASGVMHAIQMHGLRIPEDIAVIGFDNSDDSQYLTPALTTIAPGLEAVARLSVRVLRDRIDGVSPFGAPEGTSVFRKVSSTLVVRNSTRPIPDGGLRL